MKNIRYVLKLTTEDFLRVSFTQDHGTIARFILQYYAFIEDKKQTIFRVDNCHGSDPHKHVYYLHGPPLRASVTGDTNTLLTEWMNKIKSGFRTMREHYLTN